MIHSFRDNWLRDFFLEDKFSKKIPAIIETRLFRKLQIIDDATGEVDLRSPPSNNFENLKGKLAGKCSVRVNRKWRLVFEWSEEHAQVSEIYLDNHDYR